MKFLALLLVTLTTSFAQSWLPFQFDNTMVFQIPEDRTETDTEGVRVVKAFTLTGDVALMRIPRGSVERDKPIANEKDLDEFYVRFSDRMMKQVSVGQLESRKSVRMDGFLTNEFTYIYLQDTTIMRADCWSVLIHEHMFCAQVSAIARIENDAELKELYFDQKAKLFSGIRISKALSAEDQYGMGPTFRAPKTAGEWAGQLMGLTILALIPIVVILYALFSWQVRRGKTPAPTSVLVYSIMRWVLVSLLWFVGGLIGLTAVIGGFFVDDTLVPMVIFGAILVLLGVGFYYMKTPMGKVSPSRPAPTQAVGSGFR